MRQLKYSLKGISALVLVLCLIIAGCSDDSGNSDNFYQDNNNNNPALLTITDMPQGYVLNHGYVMNKSDIEWGSYSSPNDVNRLLPADDAYKPYLNGSLSKKEGSFNTADIYPQQYEFVNGVWTSKSTQGEFNYTGKGSVWVYFQTGQNPKLYQWGWNDVDFIEGKATVAFPKDEDIGGGTFPEPIGKLTINDIPSDYNNKYIFLGGGASDVTALYGMNDITFTSYTNYTYHLVKITDGSAVVPLYKINTGATSYSTLFSPYDGNGSITALSIIILNDSELILANAATAITNNYVALALITSGSFSGGSLTVSPTTWTPKP